MTLGAPFVAKHCLCSAKGPFEYILDWVTTVSKQIWAHQQRKRFLCENKTKNEEIMDERLLIYDPKEADAEPNLVLVAQKVLRNPRAHI